MVDLDNLSVSLTKNGYIKLAQVVRRHPSNEIADNVYGVHPGIKLQWSQAKKILGADANDTVPAVWDEIRKYDRNTIEAFTFFAILFSHHQLIELFIAVGQGRPKGIISRSDLAEKAYTNLHYAMSEVDLCVYDRSADSFSYDLTPLIDQLRPARRAVEKLLRNRLERCGWRDPDVYRVGADGLFIEECQRQEFHKALGLKFSQFREWITGRPAVSK